jgi:hypothetical protein
MLLGALSAHATVAHVHHPSETSREIASIAPRAELVERWKEPELVADTIQRVRSFLKAHTPR